MKNPTISIIVPVYNKEKRIKKCIDSLLAQTFEKFELILINDGSVDNSGVICDEYKNIDNRVIVFHQENKGVGRARNFGINKARGEYICFIDAGDYVEDDFLAVLHTQIKKNNVDVVECSFYYVLKDNIVPKSDSHDIFRIENKNIISALFGRSKGIMAIDSSQYNKVNIHNRLLSYTVWNKLYSRQSISGIKFNEGYRFIQEDILFNHEVFSQIKSLIYLGIPKYYYIVETDSLSHSKMSFERLKDLLVGLKMLLRNQLSINGYEDSQIMNYYYNMNYTLLYSALLDGLYKKGEDKENIKRILQNLQDISTKDDFRSTFFQKILLYISTKNLLFSSLLCRIFYRFKRVLKMPKK